MGILLNCLASSRLKDTKVALKIIRGASRYSKSAEDEIQLLRRVSTTNKRKSQFIVSFLDHFTIIGPNGLHTCLVFESLGCNLFTLIRMYEHKGVPVPLVKIFIKQILFALDYLHCYCQIIHTDLKPENILLYINPNLSLISKGSPGSDPKMSTNRSNDGSYENTNEKKDDIRCRNKRSGTSSSHTKCHIERRVPPKNKEELLICFGNGSFRCKVVDLGNACWVHKHFTDQVQTRQYRAPEVILGCSDYNTSIDIWSLACIAFELLTGDLLFTPHSSEYYDKNDDHLTQMIELLGNPPRSFVRSCRLGHHYLTKNGSPKHIHKLCYWPLQDVLIEKYRFLERDAAEICDFLLPMLEYSPMKRATAAEQLKHPWIRNIDVDDFSTAFD
ncbi:serine/threonine-protein kinase SRPK-like isoform X2 [Schistocerca gregaria]|uniref:serine/threonine-protein kinase SRPK-like isoform X2 n=1 Tax=Schistocerca gregaria TaxID=7010 RepID=UPI00211DF6EC|nr:serine/threonine-protein kinase SRPK-like isoform X2 [Schistocerca gregaria]